MSDVGNPHIDKAIGELDAAMFSGDGFDDINALTFARKRALEESQTKWHSGRSKGEVVGVLKRIDDIDAENEVVIVPRTGAETIPCTFPETMRAAIGAFIFKSVKVSGILQYEDYSPHPQRVIIRENGIELYPLKQQKMTFREMRGLFATRERPASNAPPADSRGTARGLVPRVPT